MHRTGSPLAAFFSGEVTLKPLTGMLLEEDLIRRAEQRAADEGRPLSDIIQDALQHYLSKSIAEPARRAAAYQFFCERPMRLAPDQLKVVLAHDSWNQ